MIRGFAHIVRRFASSTIGTVAASSATGESTHGPASGVARATGRKESTFRTHALPNLGAAFGFDLTVEQPTPSLWHPTTSQGVGKHSTARAGGLAMEYVNRRTSRRGGNWKSRAVT